MNDSASEELSAGMRLGGTPLYIAPERMMAPSLANARVDIYSLGALAHYLLTGRPVFEIDNDLHLLYKVMNEKPPRASQVAPQPIPGELEVLVLQCLSKDPEDRPQSVDAIRDALNAVAAEIGSWTQAEAATWWERTSPTGEVQEHRRERYG